LYHTHDQLGGTDSGECSPGKLLARQPAQKLINSLFQPVLRHLPVPGMNKGNLFLILRLPLFAICNVDTILLIFYDEFLRERFLLFLITDVHLSPWIECFHQRVHIILKLLLVKANTYTTQRDYTSFHALLS